MVSETDDEMCVLSIIKIYSYYSFVFSVMPLKIELKKNIESYFEDPYHQAKS